MANSGGAGGGGFLKPLPLAGRHFHQPWGLSGDLKQIVDLLVLQIQKPGYSLNFYIQVMSYYVTYEIALFNPVNKIILSLLGIIQYILLLALKVFTCLH